MVFLLLVPPEPRDLFGAVTLALPRVRAERDGVAIECRFADVDTPSARLICRQSLGQFTTRNPSSGYLPRNRAAR